MRKDASSSEMESDEDDPFELDSSEEEDYVYNYDCTHLFVPGTTLL